MELLEFLDFFKLYIISPDIDFFEQFIFMFVLVLLSMGQYAMELYHMVKKKTAAETIAVMQLPLGFSLLASVFLMFYAHVPKKEGLYYFYNALDNRDTALGLALLALLNVVLIFKARFLWNRRKYSCVMGAVLSFAVGIPGISLFLSGNNFFRQLPDTVLVCFLYLVLWLASSEVFLILGTIVCICTAKINIGQLSVKKPVPLFWFYEIFCQNAMLRGTLLLWVPIALFYSWMWGYAKVWLESSDYIDFLLTTVFSVIFCVIALVFALRPAFLLARRLGNRKERRKKIELFCREYFLEPPIKTGKSYTITSHFLVDEESPGMIYEWSELCGCSDGYVSTKNGWASVLCFNGSRICELLKDNEQTEDIMRFARQRLVGIKPLSSQGLALLGQNISKQAQNYKLAIGICLLLMTVGMGFYEYCVIYPYLGMEKTTEYKNEEKLNDLKKLLSSLEEKYEEKEKEEEKQVHWTKTGGVFAELEPPGEWQGERRSVSDYIGIPSDFMKSGGKKYKEHLEKYVYKNVQPKRDSMDTSKRKTPTVYFTFWGTDRVASFFESEDGIYGHAHTAFMNNMFYMEIPTDWYIGSSTPNPLVFYHKSEKGLKEEGNKMVTYNNAIPQKYLGNDKKILEYILSGGIWDILKNALGKAFSDEYVLEGDDLNNLSLKKGEETIASIIVWSEIGQIAVWDKRNRLLFDREADYGRIMALPEWSEVDFSTKDAIIRYMESESVNERLKSILGEEGTWSSSDFTTEFHAFVRFEGDFDRRLVTLYIPVTMEGQDNWLILFETFEGSKVDENAYAIQERVMKTFTLLPYYYVVKEGDTLSRIARKYGSEYGSCDEWIKEIMEYPANQIPDENIIITNQRIEIPLSLRFKKRTYR